ncbi:AtpZ/AtpI family protein [Gluconobacter sp. NFX36]|uniref:F0F1 ATP synthase assembly protein I n=1 Tax=Gluconobacter japonicus TaxID=376620 RepID=A0A149S112_GLUJA|nr:AtpZ/AtpI family protein [Gluconobacter japonicus]GAP23159.1 ATP synthase F0 subunit I [Gluconobacter frateurii NBRC 101659]KXV20431.1 ATP synthase I [Gluconobacter japonicus]KXV26332.1 ATP synthase I [Gluconobacter japonicus]KXV27166.1 ATP synthase I [Gluconobacter japonicus]KXV27977.1 ATP synthase I [Gluconobacter japonicus]
MADAPSDENGSFDERLKRARKKLDPRAEEFSTKSTDEDTSTYASFGVAIRVGTELVAGLAVGVALGYALDRWLGYRVLFLLLFALLGFGAGMMNVWRVLNGPGMVPEPKDDGRSQRGSRIDD